MKATLMIGLATGLFTLTGAVQAQQVHRQQPLPGLPSSALSERFYLNERHASAADREISERVVTALRQSERLRGQTIGVETVGGVVRLSGTLDRVPQIYEAVSIVRRVPGVRRINDDALM